MDLNQLNYFLTVAAEGNLTKASKKLHTVQSNVTTKIKRLEAELGHALFERSRSGMALTERGLALIPYARQMRAMEADIKKVMSHDMAPMGNLSIACLDTFIRIFLGTVIPKYVKRYPSVNLTLQTAFNPGLFRMLEDGSADIIGVVGREPFEDYETVFSKKYKLILLSKTKETKEQPLLILGNDCFFGQALTEYFDHSRSILKISSIESILASVSAGIGITLLPESLVNTVQCKSLFSRAINIKCIYSLLRKKNRPMSSAEHAFIESVKIATE